MKYILILLLTLSFSAFAGNTHNHGGDGGNASNTNLVGANSSSNSGAYSTSGLNNSGNSASVSGGGEVGDITTKAKVKNSGNSEQDQSNENDIRYSSVYEATEAVASTAPSISVGVCQNGASGQNKDYGFSFLSDSVYCNILNQAEVERANAKRSLNADDKKAHYANAHMLDEMALDYIKDTSTIGKWATNAMYVGQILLVVVLGIAI